jgi:hypothetical protein
MSKRSVFVMDVKVGQSVTIDNGRVVIILEDKSGKLAKLKFLVAPDVVIQRPGAANSRFRSGAKQALLGVRLKLAA